MTSQLPHFGVFFSAASSKKTKTGAAVTLLRSSLFRDDFKKEKIDVFYLFDY